VDISDPDASGTPLILPGVLAWQRMEVATGAMPIGTSAPGLAVTLVPRRPASAWTRSLEFTGAGPGLLSRTTTTIPPAIDRLNDNTSGSFFASGPIVPDRLGLVVAADWTKGTHFERDDPTQLHDALESLFSRLLFTPTGHSEISVIGWVQRTRAPSDRRLAFSQPAASDRDTSVHVQTQWDRKTDAGALWTGFAAFSSRARSTDLAPAAAIVTERLRDGPVPYLMNPLGTDKAWSFGESLTPAIWRGRHLSQAGVTISGGTVSAPAVAPLRIGELVDGVPARVWDYTAPIAGSHWHDVTLSAFASDSFAVHPRVTIDAGLRFDLVRGAAATNPQRVSWSNLFPTAGIRWTLTERGHIDAIGRFSRYGYRLPLGDLAYGDASAATANVYQWTAAGDDPGVQQRGALVSRVGPGAGGDPQLSALDPNLARPYMDEVILGFEGRPNARTIARLMGVVRREHRLIGLVDTGVPPSSYLVSTMVDPGVDRYAGQILPVYNRPPSAFGADRYVLTNPADERAEFYGVEVTAQTSLNRLFLIAGGTAGRSEGLSANRGFLATENDQGLVGEVFTDPNAATNALGRLFTERGYTIKTAGTYRFPHDVRLGLAARYQDGQHFARLVIVPDLNQGAEAIRASVNGKTRFTYTMTVDARLQKAFALGGSHLTALVDAYNLFNTETEIEEFSVTGPASRLTAAVQPPRSFHVGLKLDF
jgi:hypothetical protein